jgi:hypothetical protein
MKKYLLKILSLAIVSTALFGSYITVADTSVDGGGNSSENSLTPDGARNIGQSDRDQGKEPANTSNSPQPLSDAYKSGYDTN